MFIGISPAYQKQRACRGYNILTATFVIIVPQFFYNLSKKCENFLCCVMNIIYNLFSLNNALFKSVV
jgi:hypothetical protein